MKKTTDIYLAAVFSALGANLEHVDRDDPKHMIFEFSPRTVTSDALPKFPVQDLDEIERSWVNKVLLINAVDLCDAIKRMKSVVHSR